MRKYFAKLKQKYYNTYMLRYSCNDEEAKDLIDFGYKKITRKRALEMVREENRARRFNMPTAGFAHSHIYPAYTRRNENTFPYHKYLLLHPIRHYHLLHHYVSKLSHHL